MIARMLTLFASAGFVAAACAPVSPAQAQDAYQLDPSHTHVQFSILRFGFNNVIGGFADVQGVVTLDEAAPENSKVEVEIGVASLASGDDTRNAHLQGEFWFNSEQFPTISFRSVSVEQLSENEANVTGDLTLLGVTKPVLLHVVLNKKGSDPASKKEAVGFSATGALKRSDFGMLTAANLVGDEVAIRIETLAHKIE